MKRKHLLELVEAGESTTTEFKRKTTTPEKIAKEIAALANTKGGVLLVGVDDDGTIVGVKSEKTEIDTIEKACSFYIFPPIEPFIEIVEYKDVDIVVAHIKESNLKPHSIEIIDSDSQKKVKRAYIRLGEKSVIASKEMYRFLNSNTKSKPLKISIGEREKRLFTYLEKHESITVKEFSSIVNISTRRAERILIDLVRAKVLLIHNDTTRDYFTLSENPTK